MLQAKWFTIEEALELQMAHNSKPYLKWKKYLKI